MNGHLTKNALSILLICVCMPFIAYPQIIQDNFEGNGNITSWFGDDCQVNPKLANPYKSGINTSDNVLEYKDIGGQYANLRFDIGNNIDLSSTYIFTLKVYVPSSGLSGNQANQISLKLQDGNLAQSWTTQTEIIKPVLLNQWQTITFDFKNDAYRNLDGGSLPPTLRKDLNRVVIQMNGENNTSRVIAYLDDFYHDGTIIPVPVYDKLIWSDEFNTNGAIDNTKWHHQTKLPNGGSWYNGEIQHYTNRIDNSFVENGILKIVAKKGNYTDQGVTKQYTSARLNSKFAFKYGKVEVRAKLLSGLGTWPAIWTLGKNINEDGAYWDNQGLGSTAWPACGEIDIMEHWGFNQNYVQSALHTPSSFGNTVNVGGQTIPTASTDYHIYTLVWTPEKLVFAVDNKVHYTYNPTTKDATTWPFDAEQYLLLNVALQQDVTSTSFSQGSMDVDYVRVYQEGTVSTDPLTLTDDAIYYPNPVSDVLHIQMNSGAPSTVDLTINSFDGKIIRQGKFPVQNDVLTIDNLGGLSSGMYIVSFTLNHKTQSVKMIKN